MADGGLVGVLVAAIPAILAYFVGWAYLHYYLSEFGIDISELDLGVETIFIYSAPPAVRAVKALWFLFVLVPVATWLLIANWHRLPLRLRTELSAIRTWMGGVSTGLKGLGLFALIAVVAALLAPLIKGLAADRADEKWKRVGVQIQATVSKPDETFAQYEDYKSCQDRRALDLIFADKDVYYMLCVSEINEASGVVYEVRRADSVLASVRLTHRNADRTGAKP